MTALPAAPPSFTAARSAPFERWLADRLAALARDVRGALGENLVALILGGGYGRGEGARVGPPGRERPYNDLDLVVVVQRRRGVSALLEPVARKHERLLEVAVDFSRPLTLDDVARWEHRLRWHDLVRGYVVLAGPPDVLERHAPAGLSAPVDLAEASRLLLNRGAGLIWALRVQAGLEPAPDADFVRRNAYKALLAVGDAYLIACGIARSGHRGRPALLAEARSCLPDNIAAEVLEGYSSAVRFKLSPADLAADASAPLAAARGLWGAAFLDLESRRHRRGFAALADYARWSGPREPAPVRRWLRNLMVNLSCGRLSARSPREPLYREAAILLDPSRDVEGWPARAAAFLRLWRRVND